MKRLFVFFAVVFLLAFPITAKDKDKEFPYFFPVGVRYGVMNALDQFTENLRYNNATSTCYQPHSGITPNISMPGSIGFPSPDLISTSGPRQKPVHQLLVFDHVVQEINKDLFRVSTLCNQYYIPGKKLRFAQEYVWNEMKQAAQLAVVFHAPTEDFAISRRAQLFGMQESELRPNLDKRLEDFPSVTLRELFGIPKIRFSNYIVRELHIGFPVGIPNVLGVTWMGGTGRVELNLQWGHTDAVAGFQKVASHEAIHLAQKFSDCLFHDCEWEAELHVGLDRRNKIDPAYHSYMSPSRVWLWGYGSFNIYAFLKETLVDFAGSYKVDPVKYAEGFDRIERGQVEYGPVLQRGLGEFRSYPLHWMAVNQRLGNPNSVYYATMACNFTPTILGGEEKTKKWLEANRPAIEEVGDSAEMASASFAGMRMQMIEKRIAQGRPGEFLKIYDTLDQYLTFEDKTIMQFMGVGAPKMQGNVEPPNHVTLFIERGSAKGWTPEQTLAAYLYWFHLRYTQMTAAGCMPNYNRIGREEIAKIPMAKIVILKQILADQGEWKQYLDATGIREDIEHELEIAKAQLAFLLDPKFQNDVKLKSSLLSGSRTLVIKKR